jgi:hypothetical protein
MLFNYPVYPLCLDPYRSRRSGVFGRPSPERGTTHDWIGVHLLSHLVWDYLPVEDRSSLLVAIPLLHAYAALRRDAFLHRVTISATLRRQRPAPDLVPRLCHNRAWMLGAALLSFDFRYWALIRWLGSEYCNDGRDWSHTHAQF